MTDDFLAREQAILGSAFSSSGNASTIGGDIDFTKAAASFPALEDLDGEISSVPDTGTSNGFLNDFDDFGTPIASTYEVKVTGGDDEVERFENEFPSLDNSEFGTPTSSFQPPFFAQPQSRPSFQPPTFTPQLGADEEEPEPIRKWRERQEEEIRRRDEASAAKKRETISNAEKAIDDFYKEYNQKTERNIKQNKENEAQFLADLQTSLSVGTTWSRIADIIELQNSQSKTLARAGPGTTDLTRFKEVLLRLKREGDIAPGAGGY
ncbi:clathrin light chain [Cantharellus anzutake]|uniref:clathrin light chain n=1 Tax=Cantharellus anzutake TaxID=1750568 RepID=UPI00190600CE|nr:clathrin light chain [Cantharellus anzutake]XP_038914115.1 clathrin light chain [Cantharellus anzutake]KAF8317273.1 clathrin light chain [Cantharellus anzutake]KAF8328239.1 clathrin light chain [Cantharellus anzutake]